MERAGGEVLPAGIYIIGSTFFWEASTVGGGVTNYNDLSGKAVINGIVVSGKRSGKDYKLLNDNGGYDFVRPEPTDSVYLARGGQPFVARVRDLITSLSDKEVEMLEDITDTLPVITEAIIGQTKYFNTTDGLLYVADTVASWNPQGVQASEDCLYVNKSDNSIYRYENPAKK